MKLRKAEGANKTGVSRTRGNVSSRRPTFGVALLLLSTSVVYTAVTVAAAREPDSQAAYGPPSPPEATEPAEATAQWDAVPAPESAYADPTLPVSVPEVGYAAVAAVVEAPEAGITGEPAESADEADVEGAPEPTATSSVVEGPAMVASSWSMSPLPEEEGGVVTSSTQQTPVTSTSAMVASPQ